MGVFGEKHTSLTREQKRQLIHQADTHKLRPTEVCDWVQKTWGLRIARVTVYSILHKQRASLMAGHKDLYQSMQTTPGADKSSSPSDQQSSNSTRDTEDPCLDRNKNSGRVNKYRASPNKSKSKSKDSDVKDGNVKRTRCSSVASDGSSAGSSPLDVSGEGARWEGQLKRVREPASVELDRAMVEFLKSSASVDSQGRRLNDAELQSHALRLAKSIPSASRMRCSFGWLRHFKRRLGVQWAADKLGRYRWIVEMDHQASGSEGSTFTPSPAPLTNNTNVKQERHGSVISTTEDDEEYHSSNEFGSDDGSVTPIVHNDNSSLSMHSASHGNTKSSSSQQPSSHSIINSFPGLFGALPPLHIPGGPSSMGTISPLATTLDPKLTSNVLSPPATTSSAFGMSVDGKMRKVPTKEEAYDMLQSLLMYYEQDHSYNGEQQTLLLPRWIHQQRQIMQHTPETEAKTIWMRQQQQLYQPFQQDLLFPFQTTSPLPLSTEAQHPYHRYSSSFSSTVSSTSSTLSPSLSPVSPALPLTPQSPTLDPFGLGFTGSATAPGFSDPFVSASAKSDVTFSSALTGLGQHILSADPSLLF